MSSAERPTATERKAASRAALGLKTVELRAEVMEAARRIAARAGDKTVSAAIARLVMEETQRL